MQRLLFDDKRARNKQLAAKLKKGSVKKPTVRGNKLQQQIALIKQMQDKLLNDADKFILIQDADVLEKYIDTILVNGIYALDTETTGLDKMRDKVVGVCLYTPGKKAAYIPIRHTDVFGNLVPGQLSADVVKEQLARLIAVKGVFHNADFDIRILRHSLTGFLLNVYWDTRIAAKLLNENEPAGLKDLYGKYIANAPMDAYNDLFDGLPFNYVPMEVGYVYAAKDAYMTYQLYEFQKQYLIGDKAEKADLVDAGRLMLNVESPLVSIIAEMEDCGIGVDLAYAEQLKQEYQQRLQEVQTRLNQYIESLPLSDLPVALQQKLDTPVNLSSSTQVAIVLYDVLKLPKLEGRGTGEDILKKLQEKGDAGVKQFITDLLEYRAIQKLLTTYIEAIPAKINEVTGKLHFNINQYGAATGRTSSSDPNMQNIPSKNKDIRKMLVPTEGYYLISADYSQQEPRILAHISQDENMIHAYEQGKDLYAWMGSKVYGVAYEDCLEFNPDGTVNPEGKKRRSSMKVVVLAIMYGLGINSLAETLKISTQEAKRIMDDFYNAFKKVKATKESIVNFARTHGYIKTVWGRKRRLPDINLPKYDIQGDIDPDVRQYYLNRLLKADYYEAKDLIKELQQSGLTVIDNSGKIAHAERQCVNSTIQGTAADISKKALVAVGADPLLKKLGYRPIIMVHDEIIGEAPKENALQAAQRKVELMKQVPKDRITLPFEVDFEITERWYGEDLTSKLI